MKKWILVAVFWGVLHASLAQTDIPVALTHVGLDSLKKAVEQHTAYKLFYVEHNEDTPVRLSVSWNRSNFMTNLGNALDGAGYTLSQMDNFLYVLKGTGILTRLPDSYFSSTREEVQESTAYTAALTSGRTQEAGSASKVYTIGDPNAVFTGNRATLSGYVKNLTNGEPVVGAFVTVLATGANVMTDMYGFYRIPIPLGKTDVMVKGYGVEDTPLMLEVFTDGALDIVMKEVVYSLRAAVVSAEALQRRRSTHVGIEKLQISRIRHIPAVFGEADVLKVVLTLPGVKTVGESSGGFNVRGGATDQNLILFNGGTLYNPTHLFGLFSAFNPDVVSDIELYKSTIPAKYGGRISSVLEVNSRQGNNQKITGSAGIGLLTGKLHLEGPIVKDKTNFIAGARTTYSDWMLGLLPEGSGYRNGTANFYDVTAGFSHKVNPSNTCYLYAYYSGDTFSFSRDTSYGYSNLNLAFKWRSLFNAKHSMTLTTGYDGYGHSVEAKANPLNAYDMRFNLEQYFIKAHADLLIHEKHNLGYGLNGVYYLLSPGSFMPKGAESIVIPDVIDRERGLELALFVSDKWDVSDKLTIDMGIRYSFYSALGPAEYYTYHNGEMNPESITGVVQAGKGALIKPYHGPEFRLSARYLMSDKLTFKAGINSMRQHIHMLSNTASASPIDVWKLSDSHIAPQTGWQAAAGLYRNFFDNQWELSVEGYYKAIAHYLDYRSGAVLNMNRYIEQDVLETTGKAYGVELMLKKPLGKLNGWLAYTYSKTMLREAGKKDVYEINGGRWYPAAYDKPHDVKIIANYKFTHRYSLSANLDYASGRPVTVPIGVYYYSSKYWFAYSDRNQYRIPDYFRLDLAFNIEASHNLKLWTHSVITFGAYNVTGRKNAFSVFYATNEHNKIQGYKLSIFGAAIPYLNYTIKF
ncbi:MAG: TonB-dependent receptor [Bacteroidales bacterium]|nr:TonB-dependent receptor [Bacteroidales bacterium]